MSCIRCPNRTNLLHSRGLRQKYVDGDVEAEVTSLLDCFGHAAARVNSKSTPAY